MAKHRRTCAWCGLPLDPVDAESLSPADRPETHGICDDCLRRLHLRIAESRGRPEPNPERRRRGPRRLAR